MERYKVWNKDKRRNTAVVYDGKVISRHEDFWHAQTAVSKHLESGLIHNGYSICDIPVDDTSPPMKASDYIKASKLLKCGHCHTSFIRLKKTPCPICGSRDINIISQNLKAKEE